MIIILLYAVVIWLLIGLAMAHPNEKGFKLWLIFVIASIFVLIGWIGK